MPAIAKQIAAKSSTGTVARAWRTIAHAAASAVNEGMETASTTANRTLSVIT